MQVTVNLDTQAVITAPSPLRMKAGAQTRVAIAFIQNNIPASLPDEAVIEFGFVPQTGWTDGPVAYRLAFTKNSMDVYVGEVNCDTESLLAAFGNAKTLNVDCEVTWSIGAIKTRSVTFAGVIEKPVLSDNATPSPDPQLYPPPDQIALKNDLLWVHATVRTVQNRFNADHTGWSVGNIVKQTGDSLPTIASITLANAAPQTWGNGAYTSDPGDGTPADNFQFEWGYDFYDVIGGAASVTASGSISGGTSDADIASAIASTINNSVPFVTAVANGPLVTVTAINAGSPSGTWQADAPSGGNGPLTASFTVQNGQIGLPPGDFIVVDTAHLGDATGYQGIGNTVDFLSGSGMPTDAVGEEGSGYVDVTNGDFYHRGSNGWAFVLNIKGPQGEQGEQGIQGVQGIAGTNGINGTNGTNGMSGSSGASAADLVRIATLQFWRTPSNFTAGTSPKAICFDGVNVWIANNGSSNVTKLVAATGALVGTYSTGAGVAICFDGTNIWVLNSNATVTVLLASTGALVNTYPVAAGAAYICFDGSNIWTAGGTILAKYLASTGAQVGSNITLPNASAYGICFDGTNIWVAEGSSGVTKVTASTGTIVGTYGGNLGTRGICFDGYYLWALGQGGILTQILPSTGAVLSSPRFLSSGAASLPLVFDGSSLWTIMAGSTIYRLNTGNGAVTSFSTTALVGTFNSNGMAFDGSRLWYPNGTNVTRI